MASAAIILVLAVSALLQPSSARPPVASQANAVPDAPEIKEHHDTGLNVEYNRYLQEVVAVLESDPEFRKKLESSDPEKIRDGSISTELQFVNHHVRNQLDDIKRKEVERLKHLAKKRMHVKVGSCL